MIYIVRKGDTAKALNVTFWEPGEDFIFFSGYAYPWQGEDTIRYNISHGMLEVDGELVGINLWDTEILDPQNWPEIKSIVARKSHLHLLTQFPKLVALDLSNTDISNEDLRPLTKIGQLRALSLAQTSISDEGLRFVGDMSELRQLNLADTKITDEGISYLIGLDKLRRLFLSGTSISDETLKKLAMMKSLRVLDIKFTNVTQEDIEIFKEAMPDCEVDY